MDGPQRLIERYLTGRLQRDEAAALREWLKSDPAHLREFVVEAYLNRGIYEILISERVRTQEWGQCDVDDLFRTIAEKQRIVELSDKRPKNDLVAKDDPDDSTLRTLMQYAWSPEERTRVIEEYARRQLDAFLAEQGEPEEEQSMIPQWRRPRLSVDLKQAAAKVEALSRTTYRAMVVASVLLLIGLAATASVHYIAERVRHFLAQRVVATLGDCQHAKWSVPPEGLELRRGRMSLEEGWAQIKFLGGTDVIVQAPCTFELQSPRSMFLENGASTAKITTPHPKGFTIETPNSRLLDLGTEFGALVDGHGDSEVHVFDGRVCVEATYGDTQKGRSRQLTKGRSARIDERGAIQVGDLVERLFYRSVPGADSFGIPGKRLDLADVLGGGNGFGTGQLRYAINPLTGRFSTFDAQRYVKRGNGQYVTVEHNDYVDGAFIPNGGGVPVIVTSQGDAFLECPATNGDANGEIQNTHARILFHSGEMSCRPVIGDRVFDTAAHPHIYLQANVGITFDLEAIRNRLTGDRIRRFVSECGVCAEVPVHDEQVDFWVLVDGHVRFSRRDVTVADGAVKVTVPLYEQNRFLTLATTQGTDGSGWDLGLFAEPALELGARTREVRGE